MRHTFRYLLDAPVAPGARVVLGRDDSHHLTRVVRRRTGDAIEVGDGVGGVWSATVVATGEAVEIEIGAPVAAVRPAGVTLYQGLCDMRRLDLVVEKASELGVAGLVVHVSSRANRVPGADAWRRRTERFARVSRAAARQAGQGRLPDVRGLVPLDRVIDEVPAGEGYLIDARGERSLPAHLADARAAGPLSLLVGPDAGFAPDEVAAARSAGWRIASLGPTTLRAETAAIVAMGVALGAIGRFDRYATDEDQATPHEEGAASATPSR